MQHDYRNKLIENIYKGYISQCKCRFDGRNVIQINGGIRINVDVTVMYVKKYYVWNPSTCNCEKRKYLASIIESYDKKNKFLMKIKQPAKRKISLFYMHFY